MAATPCDWLMICEHPGIPKAWGLCGWSFPSIWQAVLEMIILKVFFFKKSWLPIAKPCNLGDVIVGELFVPHGEAMIPVKFHLNLCNRFGEKFWSFYVKKKYACRTTWAMNVINFFPPYNLAQDDPQKFSCWMDKAFNICNYDIIIKPPMISSKTKSNSFPMGSIWHVPSLIFFPWSCFRDNEVKSFSFFPTWLHTTWLMT